MGFRGDAVNLEQQLSKLIEYQNLLLEQKNLEQLANELKGQAQNDAIRDQLLAKSTELSDNVTKSEALARERKRLLEEQQLVAKRYEQDQTRLRATAVSRDAIALQHEIDTLEKRAVVLAEEFEGLEEEIASQNEIHHQIEREREQLERELELSREAIRLQLDELRVTYAKNKDLLAQLKPQFEASLLSQFERLFARGVAIGMLRKSMCGACNMTLTSTAINSLLSQPKDALLHCPECGAILVRE